MQIRTERKIGNNIETANLWFLGLFVLFSITPSFAEDSTTVVDLLDYSTIHSLGFELRIDGDDNHNAICVVRYRLEDAGEWKTALDLYRIDYTPPEPVKRLIEHPKTDVVKAPDSDLDSQWGYAIEFTSSENLEPVWKKLKDGLKSTNRNAAQRSQL